MRPRQPQYHAWRALLTPLRSPSFAPKIRCCARSSRRNAARAADLARFERMLEAEREERRANADRAERERAADRKERARVDCRSVRASEAGAAAQAALVSRLVDLVAQQQRGAGAGGVPAEAEADDAVAEADVIAWLAWRLADFPPVVPPPPAPEAKPTAVMEVEAPPVGAAAAAASSSSSSGPAALGPVDADDADTAADDDPATAAFDAAIGEKYREMLQHTFRAAEAFGLGEYDVRVVVEDGRSSAPRLFVARKNVRGVLVHCGRTGAPLGRLTLPPHPGLLALGFADKDVDVQLRGLCFANEGRYALAAVYSELRIDPLLASDEQRWRLHEARGFVHELLVLPLLGDDDAFAPSAASAAPALARLESFEWRVVERLPLPVPAEASTGAPLAHAAWAAAKISHLALLPVPTRGAGTWEQSVLLSRGSSFFRATWTLSGDGLTVTGAWTTDSLPEPIRTNTDWPLVWDVHADEGLLITRGGGSKSTTIAVKLSTGDTAFSVEREPVNGTTGILALPSSALCNGEAASRGKVFFALTNKNVCSIYESGTAIAGLQSPARGGSHACVAGDGDFLQGYSCCVQARAYLPSTNSIALAGSCGEGRSYPLVAYKLERRW
jgi:hypothetical protein